MKQSVCPKHGCPNLQPCPAHSRPANASWSKGRDHAAHARLKRTVIAQRGPRCQRCGWTTTPNGRGLEMHHTRPSNEPSSVILVCKDCHAAIDTHAR